MIWSYYRIWWVLLANLGVCSRRILTWKLFEISRAPKNAQTHVACDKETGNQTKKYAKSDHVNVTKWSAMTWCQCQCHVNGFLEHCGASTTRTPNKKQMGPTVEVLSPSKIWVIKTWRFWLQPTSAFSAPGRFGMVGKNVEIRDSFFFCRWIFSVVKATLETQRWHQLSHLLINLLCNIDIYRWWCKIYRYIMIYIMSICSLQLLSSEFGS